MFGHKQCNHTGKALCLSPRPPCHAAELSNWMSGTNLRIPSRAPLVCSSTIVECPCERAVPSDISPRCCLVRLRSGWRAAMASRIITVQMLPLRATENAARQCSQLVRDQTNPKGERCHPSCRSTRTCSPRQWQDAKVISINHKGVPKGHVAR